MSSSSINKTPIHRTPANTSGKANVDLVKSDFDALVWNKGYDVYVDKAIKCPCATKNNGAPLSSCKNCGGSGWTFVNRYQTKMILQSMNIDTQYKEWSEERLGTVRITARTEDELALMDRITLLSGLMSDTETIHPFKKNNALKSRLNQPPVEIEEIFAFVESGQELKKLVYGTDVSVEGTDFSVSGNILTFSNEYLAWPNFTVSIRYKHYPSYHVIDLPRGVIETEALDRSSGKREYNKLPIHAVGRLAHYVMDEQNIAEDFILDNSYDVNCVGSANIQIPENRACPDSVRIVKPPVVTVIDGDDEFELAAGATYTCKAAASSIDIDINGTDYQNEVGSDIDIPVVNVDDSPVGTVSSSKVTIANSNVSNSDNSVSLDISPEQNLSLPNINVTLNGSDTIKSVPAAINTNIDVEYADGTDVGSIVGNKVIIPTPGQWQRNPDWPTIPTVNRGDHEVYGVYAIYEGTENALIIELGSLSTGTGHTIYWGDGSSDFVSANTSGIQTTHIYDYNTISSTVLQDISGDNYKAVLIRIDLDPFARELRINNDGGQYHYCTGWLDLVGDLPKSGDGTGILGLITLDIGGDRQSNKLERVLLTGGNISSAGASFRYLLSCSVFSVDLGSISNFLSSFIYTNDMRNPDGTPLTINFSSATNLFNMFTVSAITAFGDVDAPNVTSARQMFNELIGLRTVGSINTPNVTSLNKTFFNNMSLLKIGTITTSSLLTNISQICQNCHSLAEVEITDCSGVTSAINSFLFCYSMKRLILTGMRISVNIANAHMSESALNDLFTSLGTANGSQTVTVSNNPGSSTCNTSIATAKGWTVVT